MFNTSPLLFHPMRGWDNRHSAHKPEGRQLPATHRSLFRFSRSHHPYSIRREGLHIGRQGHCPAPPTRHFTPGPMWCVGCETQYGAGPPAVLHCRQGEHTAAQVAGLVRNEDNAHLFGGLFWFSIGQRLGERR